MVTVYDQITAAFSISTMLLNCCIYNGMSPNTKEDHPNTVSNDGDNQPTARNRKSSIDSARNRKSSINSARNRKGSIDSMCYLHNIQEDQANNDPPNQKNTNNYANSMDWILLFGGNNNSLLLKNLGPLIAQYVTQHFDNNVTLNSCGSLARLGNAVFLEVTA